MKYKCTFDTVIVEKINLDVNSSSGLILNNNRSSIGIIRTIGDGILNRKTGHQYNYNLCENDIVIFDLTKGVKIEQNLYVMEIKSIQCKFNICMDEINGNFNF